MVYTLEQVLEMTGAEVASIFGGMNCFGHINGRSIVFFSGDAHFSIGKLKTHIEKFESKDYIIHDGANGSNDKNGNCAKSCFPKIYFAVVRGEYVPPGKLTFDLAETLFKGIGEAKLRELMAQYNKEGIKLA